MSSLEKVEYGAIVESDHTPILMNLSFNHIYTSRPQWRFNTTLLSDEMFCSLISIAITVFLETNRADSVSPSLLWEILMKHKWKKTRVDEFNI